MDRKVLTAVFVVGLVATIAGAGLYAYFSDTETSTGNVFQAGTWVDLKLKHLDEPYGDGVTATWTLSNMKPGDETPTASVYFKNFGSLASSAMEITCDYSVDEEANAVESDTDPDTDEHPEEMAKYMVITSIYYRNGEIVINCLTGNDTVGEPNEDWKISDTDEDGRITLYDLKTDPLVNLPSPDTQTNMYTQLDMRIKFDEAAGNDFQGDIFDLTMIFTLKQ